MFDSTIATNARVMSPGPTQKRAKVAATHPTVVRTSRRFLAARKSAKAPSAGIDTITTRLDRPSAKVQARVAHGALAAATLTK